MSGITPNQWTILEALQHGPRWSRSFQTVKPLYEDLIERGLIERCRPHLGRGANQLRLTRAGCELLEIDPGAVPVEQQKKPAAAVSKVKLGEIKATASLMVRATCEAFVRAIRIGDKSSDAVRQLAEVYDVQRPAIWRRLRDGGVLPSYSRRQANGRGRPIGGGASGYTASRREKSAVLAAERWVEPSADQFVDRDPCPRCGARADFGCGHSRAPIGMML